MPLKVEYESNKNMENKYYWIRTVKDIAYKRCTTLVLLMFCKISSKPIHMTTQPGIINPHGAQILFPRNLSIKASSQNIFEIDFKIRSEEPNI